MMKPTTAEQNFLRRLKRRNPGRPVPVGPTLALYSMLKLNSRERRGAKRAADAGVTMLWPPCPRDEKTSAHISSGFVPEDFDR